MTRRLYSCHLQWGYMPTAGSIVRITRLDNEGPSSAFLLQCNYSTLIEVPVLYTYQDILGLNTQNSSLCPTGYIADCCIYRFCYAIQHQMLGFVTCIRLTINVLMNHVLSFVNKMLGLFLYLKSTRQTQKKFTKSS